MAFLSIIASSCFSKLKLCIQAYFCLVILSRDSLSSALNMVPPIPCVFTIEQAFQSSFPIKVTVNITNLPNNAGVQINVTESDPDKVGNLRGLFFNVSSDYDLKKSAHLLSKISGSNIKAKQVKDNGVIDLGNGANMKGDGNKKYDVGIAFGNSGSGKDDESSSATIYLKWTGLSTANFCEQPFGVRLTSAALNGMPQNKSSKIFGNACRCTPSEAPSAEPTGQPSTSPTEKPSFLASPNHCVFTIEKAFQSSFPIKVTVNITNLPNNAGVQINVTESDPDKVGNLRGLFFNVSSDYDLKKSAHLLSKISGSNIKAKQVKDNGVIDLGNGANMKGDGNKKYDVGIAFGNSGSGKDDESSSATIYLKWTGLTTANFCEQPFGVRLTSTALNGMPQNKSSKIFGNACSCTPGMVSKCENEKNVKHFIV
jgi:hypothetical protein